MRAKTKKVYQVRLFMGGLNSGGDRSVQIDKTTPNGLPSKPVDLGAAGDVWDELVSMLEPGILRRVDCFQLQTLAQLIVQSRMLANQALSDPSDPKKNRSWLSTVDQVRKLSALFGLSPMDRSRLKIDPSSDEPDEFQEWLARAVA
jgi:hypothetical protein